MMISANGMVPAGHVSFSPHPRNTYEQFELILPLERCEDSKAQIKFMHVLEECSKTPRENSYIQQLAFKKEGIFSNGYDLHDSPSKRLIASPSRQRLSLHKQRGSEVLLYTPVQYNRQERYSKYDNNSRLVPRKSQANHM
jgi:predicted transposase YdaD